MEGGIKGFRLGVVRSLSREFQGQESDASGEYFENVKIKS